MVQLDWGCVTHNLQWGGCKEAEPVSHSVYVQCRVYCWLLRGTAYNRDVSEMYDL